MRGFVCWVVGCSARHNWEGGKRYSPDRGATVPCLAYFCSRCGATSTRGNLDRRSLYRRTFPVWVFKLRNSIYSRKVAKQEAYRQSPAGRADYLAYLAEQSRKLVQSLI